MVRLTAARTMKYLRYKQTYFGLVHGVILTVAFFHDYPDYKWYLFTETDTYVFWATLLQYLGALDHTQPYYLGAQINIGPITFGHGGASFAVSNEALRRVTGHYLSHKKEWEDFTDGHWAGDCVLGKAFKDADAPLTLAWPLFQSDDSGVVPYARADNGHRLWCMPTVSYHHLSPDMIYDMWTFKQQWLAQQDMVRSFSTLYFQRSGHALMQHSQEAAPILRHKDVFAQYTLPRIRAPKADWDNECEDDQGTWDNGESCEYKCNSMPECLQFSYNPSTQICKTSTVPRMGQARVGTRSGWFLPRIEKFAADIQPCGNEGWIT